MHIEEVSKTEKVIHLDESDVQSAVRAFVVACHPEFASGWVINVPDCAQATAEAKKEVL